MDRHDFTRVVRERAVPWRRVTFLICGDWGRAEDLMQVVLIRLYRQWHRIDENGLEAYVRRIISRLAVDEAQRAARRGEVLGEVPDLAGTGVAVDEAVSGVLDVRAALRKVPPRQRAVLVLRFYDELTVAETATALRISQGTVKSQSARGLQALQTALGLPVEPDWAPPARPRPTGHTERRHTERLRG
ncbi:sigma-70 family RNA polymerase sigma factor [Actinosynnema sp. NPDC023587]|uniref:RNA polymerase sigma factor n=1 Tax=Actinosynnema sp. NPDC023587 TaxID=3154695 RepID=UPI003409562B